MKYVFLLIPLLSGCIIIDCDRANEPNDNYSGTSYQLHPMIKPHDERHVYEY